MKKGGYVGLKQAFVPNGLGTNAYHFGIVVGVISSNQASQVLIQLYDPEQDICYTGGLGATAIYQFSDRELESLDRSSDLAGRRKEGWAA